MELTQKQIILIAAISGLILLLTVGAVLIFDPGEAKDAPTPTATPQATHPPCAHAVPRAIPLPNGLSPAPGAPVGRVRTRRNAGRNRAFVPREMPPGEAGGPWVDAGDEQTKDILAVGLREGRAAALLLLRLSKDTLTVLALPGEETPLAGSGPKEQGEEAAALVANRMGLACAGWMALDLECLPDLLAVTGPLSEAGAEALPGDSRVTLRWMHGALSYLRRASLLQFPAFKRAVGRSFASNLTARDLWSLFWTVRSGVAVRELALSPGERWPQTQNIFQESG